MIEKNDTILVEIVNNSKIEEFNNKDGEGQTPLFLAATEGRKAVVELLIEKKSNLTTVNNRGESLLHQAVIGGDLDILDTILVLNEINLNSQDNEGNTVMHFVALQKPKKNLLEICQKLMEDGATASLKNDYHKTPYHIAVASSLYDLIKTMLRKRKDGVDIRDNFGHTPLQIALDRNLTNIFEILINYTANPFVSDNYGRTIIHNSVLKGDIRSLKSVIFSNKTFRGEANAKIELVDGLNIRDLHSYTALHIAAEIGYEEAFKVLLQQKVNLTTINRNENTVLHSAIKGRVFSIVKLLLNGTMGTDEEFQFVNKQNNDGQTALHLAVVQGEINLIDFLLQKKSDPLIKDIANVNSLELSASFAKLETIKLFSKFNYSATLNLVGLAISNGNDEDVINYFLNDSSVKHASKEFQLLAAKGLYSELDAFLETNELNTTVETEFSKLMRLITLEHEHFITELAVEDEDESSVPFSSKPTLLNFALFFQGDLKTVDILLKQYEDVNSSVPNVNITWSPIDIAAFRGKRDIVDFFLKSDENLINRTDRNYQTVMHKAAWGGQCEIIQYLYNNYSADINLKDKFHRTPLHIAAMRGYSEAVKCILELDTDALNIKDKFEFTPLHLAEIYGHHLFFSALQQTSITLDPKLRYKMRYPGIENRLRNHTATIELLLHKDADPNAQDAAFGWTILHWASANGDLKVVKMLVEDKEAKVNLPSRSDQTPLYLARFWGRRDVYDYLKSSNAVW